MSWTLQEERQMAKYSDRQKIGVLAITALAISGRASSLNDMKSIWAFLRLRAAAYRIHGERRGF